MRNSAVDTFRFLGAIGVVYFHHQLPLSWIGLAAVPMFTMMLVYFEAIRPREPVAGVLERANVRLMVPWAVWSMVYAAAKIAEINLGKSTFAEEFPTWVLWVGPAIHLWFLPFAFTATLLVRPLLDGLARSASGFWVTVVLFQVFSFSVDYFRTEALDIPFQQWVSVLPAFLFGLSMFFARSSTSRILFLIGLGAFNLTAGAVWFGPGNMVQTALAAFVSVCVCLVYSQAATWASNLGKTAITIYLVHPLITVALARMFGIGDEHLFLSFVAVVVLSTAFAMMLCHPLAQWQAWKEMWRGRRVRTLYTH